MPSYAALDVSQETTAICVVDEAGRISFGSGLRLDRWPYGFGTNWLRAIFQSCALMLGMPTLL